MSSKEIIRITTEDTKRTYEFPGPDNPTLYSVELKITAIGPSGKTQFGVVSATHIHLEEKTLLRAGLSLHRHNASNEKVPTVETPADLIIRLLEHVGVYPVK